MISKDASQVPAICNFEPAFTHLGTTWNLPPNIDQNNRRNEVHMDWPLSVAEKQSRAFELYQREAEGGGGSCGFGVAVRLLLLLFSLLFLFLCVSLFFYRWSGTLLAFMKKHRFSDERVLPAKQ